MTMNPSVARQLRQIPGVGPAVAGDLWDLGFRAVADLRGQDPEAMYERLCALQGTRVDRCMLYVFRCAVYYASTPEPDPELLKWWSWKHRTMQERESNGRV